MDIPVSSVRFSADVEHAMSQSKKSLRLSILFNGSKSIQRYKNFLLLFKKYPNQKLVPTLDIDLCWHLHLQHFDSYKADCITIIGRVINHNQGFGKIKEEKEEWKERFAFTSKIWELEYGEPYKNTFLNKSQYCNGD